MLLHPHSTTRWLTLRPPVYKKGLYCKWNTASWIYVEEKVHFKAQLSLLTCPPVFMHVTWWKSGKPWALMNSSPVAQEAHGNESSMCRREVFMERVTRSYFPCWLTWCVQQKGKGIKGFSVGGEGFQFLKSKKATDFTRQSDFHTQGVAAKCANTHE